MLAAASWMVGTAGSLSWHCVLPVRLPVRLAETCLCTAGALWTVGGMLVHSGLTVEQRKGFSPPPQQISMG